MGHISYAPRSSSYAGGFTDMQAKHAFLRKQTSFAPQRACFIALFVNRRKLQIFEGRLTVEEGQLWKSRALLDIKSSKFSKSGLSGNRTISFPDTGLLNLLKIDKINPRFFFFQNYFSRIFFFKIIFQEYFSLLIYLV